MTTDVLIYETGNGGDLKLRGNDLATVEGYENAPYLSMFGGNRWWGNYLVPDNPFAAKTEEALRTNALTSAGRIAIEDAVKEDLKFLNDIPDTVYTVSTTIANSNRIDIVVNINGKPFELQWHPDSLFLTYRI
jgi:hypothetical protein